MKILYVIAHLEKGGGQQIQCCRLIREISKKHDVKLITLKVKNHSNIIDLPCDTEFVGELKFPSGIFNLKNRLNTLKNKYDIIHALDAYYSFPAIYLSKCKNSCLRLGINPGKELIMRKYYHYALIYYLFADSAFKKLNKLVVNSKTLQKEFKKYNPEYIPNGYEINEFIVKLNKISLRKKLGLPTRDILLLYSGKIIPRKNLDVIFKALRDLPGCKLVLLGNKNEEHYGDKYYRFILKKYNEIKNQVIHIDEKPMSEVKYYLNACDIFVFPSILEGSPNSVLEAMCAKIPVICSDIDAHREIIGDNERGLLFRNSNELIGNIKNLTKDSYLNKMLIKKAYDYVKKNNNIKKIAKKYESVYENIKRYK